MQRVYLDANATTPLATEVFEAMRPYWLNDFGNPSSIHMPGQRARTALEQARETLAEFLNCREAELVFTSGGTEADNTALCGMLHPGEHLVTSAIEHSAILNTAERLEKLGVEVTRVQPQADGSVRVEDIAAALRPNTRLISLMLANNETGVVQPVAEVGRLAAEREIYFHVDAVQGFGKMAIDVRELGCHLLSASAHKIYGPKGAGLLYIRRGTPLEPLITGGSHENRRRAGTENVPAIVGFGKAVELAQTGLDDGTWQRVAQLRNRLEAGLLAIDGTGLNAAGLRVSNTSNIWFDQLEGEALVIALDLKGIAVSGGSACHSGATQPSHVLMSMGLSKTRARQSLRLSLLRTATEADVDYALSVIPEAVERLRAIAPAAAGTAG